MKFLISLVIISLLILKLEVSETVAFPKGVNGGYACAGCTFAVSLIEQLAQVYNNTVDETVNDICNLLPYGVYYEACKSVIDKYGPAVIDLLYAKVTPDIICHTIRFCRIDPGQPFCHLFPLPKDSYHGQSTKELIQQAQAVINKQSRHHHLKDFNGASEACKLPGIKLICELVSELFTRYKPAVDFDKDGFSTIETIRGTNWRGRDCDDINSAIYPGTKPKYSDVEIDSNCNGIYGVDSEGIPYEDKFCKGSSHLGVGILGDSAGAHFHIPEEWLMASQIRKDSLQHLPFVLENQLDWPMMSAATGYINITWPIIQGPVQSIYTMMRARNRCIHRDYQNLAVNGASCINMQKYQKELARNQTSDYPMLMFYSLVGNDVCNHEPDTLAHMTTAKQMETNLMETLRFLDHKLPKGSHLVILGLADGRILYNNMHQRYHPVGQLNKDIKYPEFYDYMKCLQISPCNGWMTSNQTLRELTYQRVVELNNVLRSVAVTHKTKFKNFDIVYFECPLMPVIREWEKIHGKSTGYQLIEPVDGFHPNQNAMMLIAKYVWDMMSWKVPHFLGDRNIYNEEIDSIFGDQGGY